MLSDLLLAEASRCRERADARRSAVTAQNWPEYRRALREALLRMLGPFPTPPVPRARLTGALQRSGYRVDRLVFESRADFPVTANVYLPADRPDPVPGVLLFCGATVEGKLHPSYQALCQGLVRKGFAVLIHDSPCQGERSMYLDQNTGEETVPRGPEQMALDGQRCLLLGESLAGWCVWDGQRALEYLADMPEVDPGRLAAVGEGGGGMLALYLAAIDERVRVVAAGGCIATLPDRYRAKLPPEPRELLIPALREGLDHWELLALVAPRPVLIVNPDDGKFPLEGARQTCAGLAALYERLGAPERVALAAPAAPRGLTRPLREEIYGWLTRWLLHEDGAAAGPGEAAESEIEIEPEESLYVVAKGQILASLGGETLFHRLCSKLAERAPSPKELVRPGVAAQRVGAARDALRSFAAPVDCEPEWIDPPAVSPGEAVEFRFQPEPGVVLSGSLRMPKEPPRGVLLWIDGGGREAAEERTRAAARLSAVVAVDPRGIGEESPRALAAEELADLAFVVGRPIVGMQLMDLLAAVRLVKELPETRGLPLTVRGVGWGGVLAVMAGALDPRIDAVEMEGALLSYRSWLRAPHPPRAPWLLLPGALPACDLPLLAAAVAPRSFVLMSPVDAEGRPASREAAAAEYELTGRLFAVFGVPGKFHIDVPTLREQG